MNKLFDKKIPVRVTDRKALLEQVLGKLWAETDRAIDVASGIMQSDMSADKDRLQAVKITLDAVNKLIKNAQEEEFLANNLNESQGEEVVRPEFSEKMVSKESRPVH